MKLNSEEVKSILPHRDPFLFIDEVVEVTGEDKEYTSDKDLVGSTVKAKYRTKKDHPIFAGHFPGNPIFPGVCQVEMMAQATSFGIGLLHKDLHNKTMDVALVSVSGTKFRKPITPEMDLDIETVCTKSRGGFMQNDCKVFHNGELMSETSVMASFKVI